MSRSNVISCFEISIKQKGVGRVSKRVVTGACIGSGVGALLGVPILIMNTSGFTAFMAICIIGIFASFGALFGKGGDDTEAEQKDLDSVARKYGASNFITSISVGSPRSFKIDAAHGLFVGDYVVNTIAKRTMAPISHIIDYSLVANTEVVSDAKSKAIKGALLAGQAGAIVGAASAKETVRENGLATLTIVTNLSDYGIQHYTVGIPGGRAVIRYLDSVI